MSYKLPEGDVTFDLAKFGYVFEIHRQNPDEFAIKVYPKNAESYWLKDRCETESGCAYLILLWLEQLL